MPSKYKPNARFCSEPCRKLCAGKISASKRGDAQRGRGEGKTYIKYEGRHMHRYIAEQKIGRSLKPGEVVHHINGNKRDNRPENLEVLSRFEHSRMHSTKYAPICTVEGCERKHFGKGYCQKHYYQIKRHGKVMSI